MHKNIHDVAISYVNLLEERLDISERELSAMREPPQQAVAAEYPVGYSNRLISELRDKSTELEVANRDLRANLSDAREVIAAMDQQVASLREELRKVKEHNSQLINEASSKTLRGLTSEVGRWTVDTFNAEVWYSPIERGARLIEEAIEAGQVAGVPMEMAKNILLKVYNGPPGVMTQELGGVLICWASMVGGLGFDPVDIANAAMADCWKRQNVIRDKWLTKVKAGISVDFAKVPSGQDDDEAHRTHRKAPSDPRASVGMAIQPSDFERMVPRNYSDTPLTNDQRGMKIIADARDALDAHIQEAKDPH